jgi:hypothetical protein
MAWREARSSPCKIPVSRDIAKSCLVIDAGWFSAQTQEVGKGSEACLTGALA